MPRAKCAFRPRGSKRQTDGFRNAHFTGQDGVRVFAGTRAQPALAKTSEVDCGRLHAG